MKIVNKLIISAQDVEVGAVFEHDGIIHMRISDSYDGGCQHIPAVELSTGRCVLVRGEWDVRLLPDAYMVAGVPRMNPACDTEAMSSEEVDFYAANYLGVGLQE